MVDPSDFKANWQRVYGETINNKSHWTPIEPMEITWIITLTSIIVPIIIYSSIYGI